MEFTYNHTVVHNNLTLKPPILLTFYTTFEFSLIDAILLI